MLPSVPVDDNLHLRKKYQMCYQQFPELNLVEHEPKIGYLVKVQPQRHEGTKKGYLRLFLSCAMQARIKMSKA